MRTLARSTRTLLALALALSMPVAAEEIHYPEDDAKAQALAGIERAAAVEAKKHPSTGWRMEDVPTPEQLVKAQAARLEEVRPEDFHAEPVAVSVAAPVNLEDPSALAALLFAKVAGGEWVGVAILGIFGLVLLVRRVGAVQAWLASRFPKLGTPTGQLVLGAVASALFMLANAVVAGGEAAVTLELLLKAVGIGIAGALPALLVPTKKVEEAGDLAAAGVTGKDAALAAHISAATSDGGASYAKGGEPRA